MPFFRLPRLVLTGPESSGKSVLAEALCSHLDGVLVREYLRDYFELNGSLSLEDALPIAQGQWANEDRGAEEALEKNRLLVCDTDLVSSLVYNRHYYKDEMNTPRWAMWEQWAEQHKKRLKSEPHAPRLYILCDIDWPWVDDGQRDEPDKRDYFRKCFEEELKAQECDFLVARGSLEERLRAVLAHLVQLPAKR